jgi:hypothetical protein
MAEAPAKTNLSDVTRVLRAGTTPHAVKLNERLGAVLTARRRPPPDGNGLVAIDRSGRELATL